MTAFALSLGANLEDRAAALQGAIDALASAEGVTLTALSRVYETDPVGGPEQPTYLNAVVIGETTLQPLELLNLAQSIESRWHRTREVRWGPRTLDIDIVTYGDVSMDTEQLSLPHPRAIERAFVCVPMLDADPRARIGDRAVAEIIGSLDSSGVHPSADVTLLLPVVDS